MHLQARKEEMMVRLEDLNNLAYTRLYYYDPFSSGTDLFLLREVFLDLKNDEEIRIIFKKVYEAVWLKASNTPNYTVKTKC